MLVGKINPIGSETHLSTSNKLQKTLKMIMNFKSLVLLLLTTIILILLLLFYKLLRMEGSITGNLHGNCKVDYSVPVLPVQHFAEQQKDMHVIIENTAGPLILIMPYCSAKIYSKEIWYSSPFFAFNRGYQMVLQVDAATHDGFLSIYLRLMKGPYDDELQQSGHWPMRGAFVVELLHQHNGSAQEDLVYFFVNELCSNCTERVTDSQEILAPNYVGGKFMFLDKLIRSIEYHKSDTLYFRISYNTCYSCIMVTTEGRRLLTYYLFHIFDYMSMFILLLIIRVHKYVTENFQVVFSLQVIKVIKYNLQMIHHVLYKTIPGNLTLMGLLSLCIIIPYIVWEFTGLLSCRSAYFLSTNAIRFFIVFAYSHAVCVYSFKNKQYIIVNPVWFLALIVPNTPMQGDTVFALLLVLNCLAYQIIVKY